MSVAIQEALETEIPSGIDIRPYVMPGASEQALRAGAALAALWRAELVDRTLAGEDRIERWLPEQLTEIEQRIVEAQRQIRRGDLGQTIDPTKATLKILRSSNNYEQARLTTEFSIDPDYHKNFRTYTLDRIAFIAAWYAFNNHRVQ